MTAPRPRPDMTLLTEAAEKIGIPPVSLRQELEVTRIGGRLYVQTAKLEEYRAWLKSRTSRSKWLGSPSNNGVGFIHRPGQEPIRITVSDNGAPQPKEVM